MRTSLLVAIPLLAMVILSPVAWAPGPPPGFGQEWYARALGLAAGYRMFGAFEVNREVVQGPFVSFRFVAGTAEFLDYTAKKAFGDVVVFSRVEVANGSAGTLRVEGSQATLSTPQVLVVAHNNPLAVLRAESRAGTNTITYTLGGGMIAVLSARVAIIAGNGLTGGLVALGSGSLQVIGSQVIATLPAGASAVFRANLVSGEGVVGSAEQDALLDALAAGSLGVEDLSVALEGGVAQETIPYVPIDMRITLLEQGAVQVVVDATLPSGRSIALYLQRDLFGPRLGVDLLVELDGQSLPRAGSAQEALRGPAAAYDATVSADGALVVAFIPSFSTHTLVIHLPDELPLTPLGTFGLVAVAAAALIIGVAAWAALRKERRKW